MNQGGAVLIRTGNTEDFNAPYITIDLSSRKYKNRALHFIAAKHPITGDVYFDIRAEWTDSRYHPMMHMDADDLIEFVDELNAWVARVKSDGA